MYQKKNLFGLAWGMHELELVSMGRKLRVEIATLCDKLKGSASNRERNVSLQITNLRSELSL